MLREAHRRHKYGRGGDGLRICLLAAQDGPIALRLRHIKPDFLGLDENQSVNSRDPCPRSLTRAVSSG